MIRWLSRILPFLFVNAVVVILVIEILIATWHFHNLYQTARSSFYKAKP